MHFRLTAALSVLLAALALGACGDDDDALDEAASRGRFSVELSGAETDTWTGTATYRAPSSYINNTRRWTIDLETGSTGDPKLVVNVILPDDGGGREYPITGGYDLGQLGNSASGTTGFVEFYAWDAPEYTWADNPGTVNVLVAEDGVISGVIDASIRHNSLGGSTTFSGAFSAVAD